MNDELLNTIKRSFQVYIDKGSRSLEKLKPLHGKISEHLEKTLNKLNNNKNNIYKCFSLNEQGGVEKKIYGRYVEKQVDITIEKNNQIIGGVGIKFVMSNFKQNKNNYFENMLGETVNIRTNKYPYFQIFIINDKLPYYNKKGLITKWEKVSKNDFKKYLILSKDNPSIFFHTPNRMFLGLIDLFKPNVKTKKDYEKYYLKNPDFKISFSNLLDNYFENKEKNINLIYNDYEDFITKISYYLLSF